ncbi:hypothetical protein MK079_04625 [Candidatus Gracilibacteria bacterium]|nr:hypothetical protein [Candidatus Gracilibacteria bacterium]
MSSNDSLLMRGVISTIIVETPTKTPPPTTDSSMDSMLQNKNDRYLMISLDSLESLRSNDCNMLTANQRPIPFIPSTKVTKAS